MPLYASSSSSMLAEDYFSSSNQLGAVSYPSLSELPPYQSTVDLPSLALVRDSTPLALIHSSPYLESTPEPPLEVTISLQDARENSNVDLPNVSTVVTIDQDLEIPPNSVLVVAKTETEDEPQ